MSFKKRTAYEVVVHMENGRKHNQYILPTEFHLIKTWLKDGATSVEVFKEEMSELQYKTTFG